MNITNIKYIVIINIVIISNVIGQEFNFRDQPDPDEYDPLPVTTLFYKLDDHILGSFTNYYGIPHLAGIAGTYGMVESGFDWRWYKNSLDNRWIYDTGFISVEAGAIAPLIIPAGFYIYGRFEENREIETTAFALVQSALISLGLSSFYKAITARKPPDDDNDNTLDYSSDFKFGLFNRGVYDGWPSGHTMTAFAMAGTLMELYEDNIYVQVGSLLYASIIGLGVSTNIHWFSDAFAGALIGYSIGNTVGSGFKRLLTGEEEKSVLNFYFTPNNIGITYRFE